MSCCSKPPCPANQKLCKKSSSSSGNPIPLNEYIEYQTQPFQLRSRKKPKSSSSSSSSQKRKKLNTKKSSTKVYNPNKSALIKALLQLSSIVSVVNENSTVHPVKDPFLGIVDPSIPLKDIVKHKFNHKLQQKLAEENPLVQEEEEENDEEFKQTLNEIIEDYKKTDRSKKMPRVNPNDYTKVREKLHQKRNKQNNKRTQKKNNIENRRFIKQQKHQNRNQKRGRKSKKSKKIPKK